MKRRRITLELLDKMSINELQQLLIEITAEKQYFHNYDIQHRSNLYSGIINTKDNQINKIMITLRYKYSQNQ